MARRVWLIRGYDGANEVFSRSAPAALSEAEIRSLLQRLATRHLSENEVISASLRKNFNGYAPHLVVSTIGGKQYGLMTTGSGQHYTATIEELTDA